MSRTINSFAVLDDSDDEQPQVKVKAPTSNKSSGAGGDVAKQSSQQDSKNRRNPNNDRNTKGGRGPRRARDGKRTYDRRSGTGRGKEIKKGGGGARNWGSDKVDAKKAEGDLDEQELNKEVEAGQVAGGGGGGNNEGGAGEEVAEVPTATAEPIIEEEEDKTMTLEEYMASKKQTVTLFGSAKSKGEKVIENEFEGKNARVAVEEDFLEKTGGKALRKKGSSAKDKGTEKLDLDFRIKKSSGGDGDRDRNRDDRPRRTGGGRGGGGAEGGGDRRRGGGDRRSGGGRGRGNGGRRGGGRGGNFALDTNAFPSL